MSAELFADTAHGLQLEAHGPRLPNALDSFPQQWDYVSSSARFKLVLCGRRSGKTTGCRLRTRLRALERPGYRKLYVTLIRRNCRKLFWRPMLSELQAAGIPFEANEVDMIARLGNGSVIEATSCDDVRSAGKIRGDFYNEVEVDEAQEPHDDVVEPLCEEVIFPMLIDRGGEMSLLFTPPDVMAGYVVDRLTDPRWTRFGWSMFDNRFIPREQIQEMVDAKGLTPQHPVYQREILGLPVVDPEALAYEYNAHRNGFEAGDVDFTGDQWRHAMGIDLGFQDKDAIVVVAWRRDDEERRLYVRHCWQDNHQDVDQLTVKVREAMAEYRPSWIVGDTGGHGAVKVLETLKNRMGVNIQGKPSGLMESVGLVNDDLRTGRLLVPAGSDLAKDMMLVTRSVDPRTGRLTINKRGYHSDLTEALRYAHHSARHFAARAPKPEPKDIRDMTGPERIAARSRQLAEQNRRMRQPWR